MDQIGHRNGVDAWLLVRRTPGISRGQRPSAACRGSAVDPKIEKRERTTTSSSRNPASYRTKGASSSSGDENPLGFWFRPVVIVVSALHCNLAEAHGLQHHGKLVSVIPPHPMRPQLRLDQMPFFEDLMAHPDMLNLLDTVGYRRFVDEDGRPIGGAHP